MRLAAIVLLAACGGSPPPPPKPRPVPSPPPPYTGHVDLRVRVEAAQLDPALLGAVEDRCLATDEVARRQAAFETARERALVDGLAAQGMRPVTLEAVIDRREGNDPVAVRLHAPWTEIDLDGARWLAGPSDTVDCGLDQPAFGASRFVITSAGAVHRLEVRVIRSQDIAVRACPAPCPTGSSMCGAHMPATVQIRWKLPAGAAFAGHLIAGIESPVLQATADPRRTPCPEIQAPP